MFWRRKKKSAPVLLPMKVTGDELLHRFLLDTQIEDSQQLSLLLGLSPLEDPDEQIALSNERVVRASLLIPLIRLFSVAYSASLVEFFRVHNDAYRELTDEEAGVLTSLLDHVATSTVIATVTQLEDMGLINYVWSEK